MTLNDIREFLAAALPTEPVTHYFSAETDRDYTWWEEGARLSMFADGVHEDAWRFYVHRFTRKETDPVVAQLTAALEADPRTCFRHDVDFEQDTRYIHHTFTVETC